MALQGKLGVVKDIAGCSLDKILMSVSEPIPTSTAEQTAAPTRLPLQMAGLVLGSAQQQQQQQNRDTQLRGSGGLTVWFVDPLAAAEIASWPASKIEPLSWPIVAELPVSMSVVLKTTAYVADNHRIVIRGAQNTILPYTNQLIVQPRGVLELSSVTVTGSVDSSAIKVLGTALLTNVTMKENGVRSTQDTCVPGAALTLMVGSYCKVISGRFLENNAGYQKCGQGGAISMVQGCTLDCHDCELSGNQAYQGAGLFVLDKSKAKFGGTTVWNSNYADDGDWALSIVHSGNGKHLR